jgi:hypothetical protein
VVPALVARLKELRNVHEQAATFSTTLTHMSTVQETMRDQLATQGVTLNTVRLTDPRIIPLLRLFLSPLRVFQPPPLLLYLAGGHHEEKHDHH